MYTKVTPKAGQNGPMWLYVGWGPTFLPFWLGITYNYFSMMVVGYSFGTDLENFGPQAPGGRKRQRAGRSAAAVRPGGLPRCPHRLGHPT